MFQLYTRLIAVCLIQADQALQMVNFSDFYRPQTKLRESNVFTPLCDSVHVCMTGGMHGRERMCVCVGEVHGRRSCVEGGCACRTDGHVETPPHPTPTE